MVIQFFPQINLQIIEGGVDIVTGRIRSITNEEKIEFSNVMTLAEPLPSDDDSMKTKDVYKELRLRGYNYK